MAKHRDSPELEPELADHPGVSPHRRFAKLVGSSVTRRVALPRLMLVIGLLVGVVVLLVVTCTKSVESLLAWVASLSDQQMPFSRIELVPEPDPWVIGGKAQILEQVRVGSGHAETIRLLDLKLDALRNDFRLCPWIKDVIKVEVSYGRLSVHLVYRKPVAVLEITNGWVIDEDAVHLPPTNIDGSVQGLRYQIRGLADPLIVIWGVETGARPRVGVPWKRKNGSESLEVDDPTVLRAARLAGFLQRQTKTTPAGNKAPSILGIRVPDEPNSPFFLRDTEQNWINWGKAPGDEKAGDLSGEERWKMLLQWVDLNGPLKVKDPDYIYFTPTGAAIFKGSSRPSKKSSG